MASGYTSSKDGAVLAAFRRVADLADAHPASLNEFTKVLAAMSCKHSSIHDLEPLLTPEVCDFGTACLHSARLLDAAVLHQLLQLGRGGDDGRLSKARQLKQAAQHCSSSQSSLQQVLHLHLASEAAAGVTTGRGISAAADSPTLQHPPASRALAALAHASRSVRWELVRWFGSPAPDTKKGMQGANLLALLPAVAALDDGAVCRLLRVGDTTIDEVRGVQALRQYADEYVAHCSTKYANLTAAVVFIPQAADHWWQLLFECVFHQG
jgi:hypothetical protein